MDANDVANMRAKALARAFGVADEYEAAFVEEFMAKAGEEIVAGAEEFLASSAGLVAGQQVLIDRICQVAGVQPRREGERAPSIEQLVARARGEVPR